MNNNIPSATNIGDRIADAVNKSTRANIFAGEFLRDAHELERKGKFKEAAQARQEAENQNSIYEYEKNREKELLAELSNFKFEPLPILEAAE